MYTKMHGIHFVTHHYRNSYSLGCCISVAKDRICPDHFELHGKVTSTIKYFAQHLLAIRKSTNGWRSFSIKEC